jgi:aryl-alcohol dehydrogenase-like predicted oxidoreductase
MNLRRDPLSPCLALDCAQLGNLYRARGEEEAAAILEEAWNAGIRQFDTAPPYGLGLSERRLGAFLHGKQARDLFSVSTKVGRLLVPRPERAWCDDDEGVTGAIGVGNRDTARSATASGRECACRATWPTRRIRCSHLPADYPK